MKCLRAAWRALSERAQWVWALLVAAVGALAGLLYFRSRRSAEPAQAKRAEFRSRAAQADAEAASAEAAIEDSEAAELRELDRRLEIDLAAIEARRIEIDEAIDLKSLAAEWNRSFGNPQGGDS